jgi:Cu-Zn family superoxide dismutase
MNRLAQLVMFVMVGSVLACAGCETSGKEKHSDAAASDTKPMKLDARQVGKTAVAVIKPSAAATTQPTMSNVTGVVTFTQVADGVLVVAEIKGLTPNTKHGFHLHEKGDLSAPDLSSAGAHYNPMGLTHGGAPPGHDEMTIMQRHIGDLGNLTSDAQGNASARLTMPNCSIGGENSLVGRSVIVHAKEDDLKTDPSGNSGGRVAGGVIQMKS